MAERVPLASIPACACDHWRVLDPLALPTTVVSATAKIVTASVKAQRSERRTKRAVREIAYGELEAAAIVLMVRLQKVRNLTPFLTGLWAWRRQSYGYECLDSVLEAQERLLVARAAVRRVAPAPIFDLAEEVVRLTTELAPGNGASNEAWDTCLRLYAAAIDKFAVSARADVASRWKAPRVRRTVTPAMARAAELP
jgi:hypothetical protein